MSELRHFLGRQRDQQFIWGEALQLAGRYCLVFFTPLKVSLNSVSFSSCLLFFYTDLLNWKLNGNRHIPPLVIFSLFCNLNIWELLPKNEQCFLCKMFFFFFLHNICRNSQEPDMSLLFILYSWLNSFIFTLLQLCGSWIWSLWLFDCLLFYIFFCLSLICQLFVGASFFCAFSYYFIWTLLLSADLNFSAILFCLQQEFTIFFCIDNRGKYFLHTNKLVVYGIFTELNLSTLFISFFFTVSFIFMSFLLRFNFLCCCLVRGQSTWSKIYLILIPSWNFRIS